MPFKNNKDKILTGFSVCSLALELVPHPMYQKSLWKRKPMLDVCSLLGFLSLEMDLTTLKISESFRGGDLCAFSALVPSSLSSDFSPSHLLMSMGLGAGCINSALSQQEKSLLCCYFGFHGCTQPAVNPAQWSVLFSLLAHLKGGCWALWPPLKPHFYSWLWISECAMISLALTPEISCGTVRCNPASALELNILSWPDMQPDKQGQCQQQPFPVLNRLSHSGGGEA